MFLYNPALFNWGCRLTWIDLRNGCIMIVVVRFYIGKVIMCFFCKLHSYAVCLLSLSVCGALCFFVKFAARFISVRAENSTE